MPAKAIDECDEAHIETTAGPTIETDTESLDAETTELQQRVENALDAHERAIAEAYDPDADGEPEADDGGPLTKAYEMGQMGAKRIGSLAIGIGVVGIVLNQMSALDIVGNSTGVINVSNIFQVAGSGLNLLVVGVIIAAAAVLLSLWSGF